MPVFLEMNHSPTKLNSRVKPTATMQEIIQLRVGIAKLKRRVELLEAFLDDDSKGEFEEYVKSKN